MLHFNGTLVEEKIIWELMRYDDDYIDDGVTISFPLPMQLNEREAINFLKTHLPDQERGWLSFDKKKWIINLTGFREIFKEGIVNMIERKKGMRQEQEGIFSGSFYNPTSLKLELFDGTIVIAPEVFHRDVFKGTRTTVNFIFNYDMLIDNQPKRIFLSHKSADKPMVRTYRDMLKALGFDPWMDEDDLIAGDKLHRGIEKGFRDSCAVVFFVTKNYVDEKYLATEVDYALSQKYDKADRFSIITLVISDGDVQPVVPRLLEQYVFKHPKSQFEGLTQILKALPLKLDSISFKD
ncbi:hypothetical protein IWX76_000054 [Pedobacter sp. CAN_A7]|uniref:toll/interleukin-1 receptor domain-containing protein n=1 Tax=Pedobacter sp. CAN_A7 TaxID=2787722 RepID=UPI0018CB6B90